MPTQTVLDTLSAIQQRRSVKHYDAGFEISQAHVQLLVDAMRESPTSFNMQNWRAVLVEDKALRQKIQEAAWNQAQVTEASLLFVLCADLNAAEKQPERYWENAPEQVRNYLVPMISKFYANNPQLQRDEAQRSCGIVGQTLMLAAKALGYDSCPMVGFDPQQVAQIIQLPADHVISMLITVGKAAKPAQPKGGYLPQSEMILRNTF